MGKTTILDDPDFQSLIEDIDVRLELLAKIGEEIRNNFLPMDGSVKKLFDIEPREFAKVLIASCISSDEIEEVLSSAGFYVIDVSLCECGENEREILRFSISKSLRGFFTRNGYACIVRYQYMY